MMAEIRGFEEATTAPWWLTVETRMLMSMSPQTTVMVTAASRLQAWANGVALAITLVVNSLANLLPMNGQTPSEIAARFPVYFVPADFTFGIWGLIYLALISFVVYPLVARQEAESAVGRIGWLFVLSCFGNAAWVLAWQYNYFTFSLVFMVIMVASVAAIYVRLGINRRLVAARERWIMHTPVSLYLGWLTVAAISNLSCVLYYRDWSGWGLSEASWMLIVLAMIAVLSFSIAWLRRDRVFLAVVVWALIGIASKHSGVELVAGASAATAGLVAFLVILLTLGWHRAARQA
ncbi:MAG: tryptophan-rich sensory protein [Gammaproteobacteria bacterium]|jgi:hypothetical protein|nr:tryptophan-rich sensory protein [Gammaproteobacteria bacterium]